MGHKSANYWISPSRITTISTLLASFICCATEVKILLVSSNIEKGKWIIPGGGIQPMEDPRCAAKREVLEEAGVEGEVCRYLGTYEDMTKHKRTFLYTMIVDRQRDNWKENIVNNKERKWCSVQEAKEELSRKQDQIPFLNLLLKSYEES